jgi:hypothetical protein
LDVFPVEAHVGHTSHASTKRASSAAPGRPAAGSARAHSPGPSGMTPPAPLGDRAAGMCVLVVASDGVWDFLSNEAVLALVCEVLATTRSADKAASAVCKAASAHGSQDDISTAVVWFS